MGTPSGMPTPNRNPPDFKRRWRPRKRECCHTRRRDLEMRRMKDLRKNTKTSCLESGILFLPWAFLFPLNFVLMCIFDIPRLHTCKTQATTTQHQPAQHPSPPAPPPPLNPPPLPVLGYSKKGNQGFSVAFTPTPPLPRQTA
jgi:hypothetical protein